MRRRVVGTINGAIAAASYGMNPLFTLPLYSIGIGANSVLFYRYALAIIIYWIWLKLVKKVSLHLHREEIIPMLILSLLFSFSSLTLFDAFKYIEAGIACTILFIYPVLVAIIMAIFFNEKITKTTVNAILLTSVGIVLLYHGKSGLTLNTHGVVVVFLSALFYALYIVGVKKIKAIQHVNRNKMSFYVMLFGLLVYIFNLKFCTQLQIIDKPIFWLFPIGLALFPTIISLETINISIKLIGSTKTAILGALEPLTAIFFGILFFNEHLTIRISIGIVLIITGVFLIVMQNSNKTIKNTTTN